MLLFKYLLFFAFCIFLPQKRNTYGLWTGKLKSRLILHHRPPTNSYFGFLNRINLTGKEKAGGQMYMGPLPSDYLFTAKYPPRLPHPPEHAPIPPPHWTSRGSYHLQPKWACRRVFVLQIAKPAGTSEVECYKRCDQIRFEYKCTVYKLVKTLHWIHLHCIIIDK